MDQVQPQLGGEHLTEQEQLDFKAFASRLRKMPTEDVASELSWHADTLKRLGQELLKSGSGELNATLGYLVADHRRKEDACSNEIHRRKQAGALPTGVAMTAVTPDLINAIKERCDLRELIEGYGIVLKRRGKEWIGKCPFHDDKQPSLSVDSSNGLWHCFGCNEGGDAISFLMRSNKCDFMTALRDLATYTGIEISHGNGNGNGHGAKSASKVKPDASKGEHETKAAGPTADDRAKIPSELAGFPETDEGNAEVFAYLYHDSVRFDRSRGRFLTWNSPRWTEDRTGEIERMAIQTVRMRQAAFALYLDDRGDRRRAVDFAQRSENRNRQHGLLEAIQHIEPIVDAGVDFDSDDWLLCCSNVVVDLRTGETREGHREDRITLCTGIAYDEHAKAERWIDFLGEVFVDQDLIDFIQRAVGYSLTGYTSEQVLFLCYGRGANGKSVFLETISRIAGEYGGNKRFSTFEESDRGGGGQATPDIVNLVGKRLLTASETREGARLNEARVKSLTGCDPITGRHLYARDEITFRPKAKIWLSANHKPSVSDDSLGFWRRIRLIPFTQTFGQGKANPRLSELLSIESDGILAWAVQGCLKWQEYGLKPPAQVTRATDEYQRESDPLASFLDECCVANPLAQSPFAELCSAYVAHCERYRVRAKGPNWLSQKLVERGFQKERPGGHGQIIFRGIGLLQK